jgi:transposase
MWIPPEEKDPILIHHPTRRSVGYYGAVRLRDGKLVWQREAGRFDGEGFWHFMLSLAQLGRRSGRTVVVIADNARYHHARRHQAWREEVAQEFRLHYLPPDSPQLNPSERIWKQTRRHCVHNRYFGQLEEVMAAVENQFRQWSRPNAVLRRLCSIA